MTKLCRLASQRHGEVPEADLTCASQNADLSLPRPAQPEDIADTVLYLATGTSMTTGQLLVVDGGKTL